MLIMTAKVDKKKIIIALAALVLALVALFSFIGDSTFFASGMTGVVNAVYNEHDLTMLVLDNSTTAMTGSQPHPGTGQTLMGPKTEPISIEGVLRALGFGCIVSMVVLMALPELRKKQS